MANDQTVAPVIIKRKKIIAADGHHGGAWKVAYADFVTAMMAFFMFMWLLNAATEQQKKGSLTILVPYSENDPLQNAPVFSFQKLIEAALGNGAATLTLESGETIAPQNVIAFR